MLTKETKDEFGRLQKKAELEISEENVHLDEEISELRKVLKLKEEKKRANNAKLELLGTLWKIHSDID